MRIRGGGVHAIPLANANKVCDWRTNADSAKAVIQIAHILYSRRGLPTRPGQHFPEIMLKRFPENYASNPAGFHISTFTHAGRSRAVLRKGRGPAVIVLHELPGPTPRVVAFAERLANAGFTAILPVLFGVPGKPLSRPYLLGEFVRICISREFYCLACNRSSPVTCWIRALCRYAHTQCGARGVGVVGMCLTGGFALALAADPSVIAPVMSQPSLPFGLTATRRSALGLSPGQLEAVKARANAGTRVLGLRFSEDRLCPRARFQRLQCELGDAFEAVEIDSSPGNAHAISPNAHSVLATDLVDRPGHPTRNALDRLLCFLQDCMT